MPEWEPEGKPKDVLSSEEENAEFTCAATGRPQPNITWTVNGKPIECKEILKSFPWYFSRQNLTSVDVRF